MRDYRVFGKTNQNFFPHTIPYHDFALGSPVLHVTVEDVRSDCFHYSPMKGSKSAGTVNRTSAPCQRFFFFVKVSPLVASACGRRQNAMRERKTSAA